MKQDLADLFPWLDRSRLPHFTLRSPVRRLTMVTRVEVEANGSLLLPEMVLWGLGLNAGDLAVIEPEPGQTVRFSFRSYLSAVERAAALCSHPWPYVEEMLRLPQAAVGAAGALELPAELFAPNELRPGDPLLLRAAVDRIWRRFNLERLADRRVVSELDLAAVYFLPIESGLRVSLPADALWALALAEGDLVACTPGLAVAECRSFEGVVMKQLAEKGSVAEMTRLLKALNDEASREELEGIVNCRLAEVGPDGSFALPDSLRVASLLEARAQVRMTVELSKDHAGFRLEPYPVL